MSPLTGGPQYGMPFMGDMSQYGMAGLPFTTGPQNGHSSSMDSTPGAGQYSTGRWPGAIQYATENDGFPLLPPFVPAASRAQDALSTEGIYQRFGEIARTADGLPPMAHELTNPTSTCKLIYT